MIYQNFILSGSNAGLRWLRWLLVMVGVGFLAACSDYESAGRPSGYLRVALKADTTLVMSQARSTYSGLTPYQNVADYKVNILQADTVVMRFSRYDEMPEKVELEPGRYTLKVSKGTDKAGGFNAPYFAGEQDFTVVQGEDTSVSVQAELKNGLVTLNLTDDFCQTYPSYLFSLKTDEMTAPLVYDEYEYRAMYFRCAATGTKVTIGMQLTDVYGKKNEYTSSVTVRPKQWTQATVKTDGKGLHGISLEVKLDETTNQTQYINIGIPDFMQLLKGAPVVSCGPLGWNEDGTTDETVVYERQEANDLPVGILAGGKVANVRLSLKDDTGALLEGIDLANLTETQADGLAEQYGYVAPAKPLKGSLTNTINVGGFVKALRQKRDTYEAELKIEVVDALPNAHTTTKVAKVKVPMAGEPTIDWNTFPADGTSFEFGSFPLEDNPVVNIRVPAGLQSLQLLMNGEEQDIVTGPNQLTRLSDTEYTLTFDRSWLNGLRCNEDLTDKGFLLKIKLVDALKRELTTNTERSFAVTTAFDWADGYEADAYAKFAYVYVKIPEIDKVKFYDVEGNLYSSTCLGYVSETSGIAKYVLKGLSPETSYGVVAKYEDVFGSSLKSFVAENLNTLPNSDFSEWSVAMKSCKIASASGVYPFTKTYTQNVPLFTINQWITNNESTVITDCDNYFGTANKSWLIYYRSFSTVTSNALNQITIRTISSGTNALKEDNTVSVPGWIKLHDGTEDGLSISSRPVAVRFTGCSFSQYNGESFVINVSVLDANGQSIAYTSYVNTSISDGTITVPLTYATATKAARITIEVMSTSNTSTTSSLENKTVSVCTDKTNGTMTNYDINAGNQLTIDKVELLYDYPESE